MDKLPVSRIAQTFDIGDGYQTIQTMTYYPIQKVQSGGVGDAVDNGLWGGFSVQPGEAPIASKGKELIGATYSYRVVAEDFAGNRSEIDGGTFIYQP